MTEKLNRTKNSGDRKQKTKNSQKVKTSIAAEGSVFLRIRDLEITVKWGFELDTTVNINLDQYSKIEHPILGPNYKGFYGIISRILLRNAKGDPQIGPRAEPEQKLLEKGRCDFVCNSLV